MLMTAFNIGPSNLVKITRILFVVENTKTNQYLFDRDKFGVALPQLVMRQPHTPDTVTGVIDVMLYSLSITEYKLQSVTYPQDDLIYVHVKVTSDEVHDKLSDQNNELYWALATDVTLIPGSAKAFAKVTGK